MVERINAFPAIHPLQTGKFWNIIILKNLYDKYHKYVDGPFLVVRNKWYGDYCFAVETFMNHNTWVHGTTFNNGIAGRQTSHHANTEEFRMYNGPSVDKIKAQL